MELLQLQYFAEIARQESYTKASQSLHVSQPALSQMMKRLENELGTKLFEREGKRVRLTGAGRGFFTRISHSLTEIQSACDDLSNNRVQGNIIIGSYAPLYPILECIEAFVEENPDVTFFFHHIMSVATNYRDFDALLYYTLSDNLGFNESFSLGEMEGTFAVPANFPIGDRTELRLSELKDAHFVSLARHDGWKEEIFQNFSHSGSVPHIRYRTNSSLMKQEILEAGMAVGASNSMLTQRFQDTGKYRVLLHSDPDAIDKTSVQIRIFMGWRDADYLSPAARELKKFCNRWFGERK